MGRAEGGLLDWGLVVDWVLSNFFRLGICCGGAQTLGLRFGATDFRLTRRFHLRGVRAVRYPWVF
jgi:hypothetical protein